MGRPNYTKKQLEEAKFHDQWSSLTDIEKINIQKYFSTEVASDYRLAMEFLGDLKKKKILDLGCGFGETSVYFALQGAKVIALEISPGMLACVGRMADKWGVRKRIKLLEAPAENIPVKSGSVDFVFGGNVLHHVDIKKTSKEVRRILKKGGKAVFIEPLGYNPLIQIYRYLAGDVRTKMERPFTFRDIKLFGQRFSSVRHLERQLLTTLIFVWFFLVERVSPRKVRYWKKINDESERYERAYRLLKKIDLIILKIPLINRMCWNTVIEVIK